MIPFDKNENIIYHVRKHWFVMALPTVLAVGASVAPFIIYGVSFVQIPEIREVLLSSAALLFFLWALWTLMWWTFWFFQWTDYYLDVWYITNMRIIDVEQKGVFHRIVSTLRYEKVQDVTFEIKGVIPVLLGFGDVHVQTAGANREIIIKDAQNPEDVKRKIVALLDKVVAGDQSQWRQE